MIDLNKELQKKSKGERAKRFLNDEQAAEAIENMLNRAREDFENSKPEDDEARRIAHTKIAVIREFAQELATMISAGRGAASTIAKEEVLAEAESAKDRG